MTVKKINYLQKAEDVIIVLTFVVMTLSAFLQVCNRNITKIPVTGFEELSKYCMIYMVLLGTEMGLRDGTQIAVTALQDKLKGRARLFILILIKAILIVFAAVMFYQSIALCQIQLKSGQTSPGLMVVPYFALLLAFGIIAIVQLIGAAAMVSAFVKGNTEKYEYVDLSVETAEKMVKEEEEKVRSNQKGGQSS